MSGNSLPRMLRQDIKSLDDTRCVAAYNTIEAILRKDAIHQPQAENLPSYNDTLFKMLSNFKDQYWRLNRKSLSHLRN